MAIEVGAKANEKDPRSPGATMSDAAYGATETKPEKSSLDLIMVRALVTLTRVILVEWWDERVQEKLREEEVKTRSKEMFF